MLKPDTEPKDELAARWEVNFAEWRSHMGQHPVNFPNDLLVVASGVDGGHQGALRRYMGHVLLEDMRRFRMRGDMEAVKDAQGEWTAPPFGQPPLQVSAARVAHLQDTHALPIIEQVFPFEISTHADDSETPTLKGFVLRMRNVFTQGHPPTNQSDIEQDWIYFQERGGGDELTPMVVLVVLDEQEGVGIPAYDAWSRFRLVIPMIPVSLIYQKYQDPEMATGLPHYKDYVWPLTTPYPDFQPEDPTVSPTTVVMAGDPIAVTHNNRFLYIFSSTGEFPPVCLWFDKKFGHKDGWATSEPYTAPQLPVQPPAIQPHLLHTEPLDTGQEYHSADLMSTRSLGWHWERFGDTLISPNNITLDNLADPDGFALAGTYETAYVPIDQYRGRYTHLSERRAVVATEGDVLRMLAGHFEGDVEHTVEQCLFYPHYEVYSTLMADQVGGAFGWPMSCRRATRIFMIVLHCIITSRRGTPMSIG